eukprot:4438359-Lingulodinium_polyedra.AAC.1
MLCSTTVAPAGALPVMRRKVDEGMVSLTRSLSHRLPNAEVPLVKCRMVTPAATSGRSGVEDATRGEWSTSGKLIQLTETTKSAARCDN